MTDALILEQLEVRRRSVDTETYDIIVRQLIDMLVTNVIDIAPDYQRHFIWDDARQSELIESIYLGIPIPNIFVAENRSGSLEVIDGVQRISTIARFAGTDKLIKVINQKSSLQLQDLTKLTEFNGHGFADLPLPVQQRFLNRSIRFTSLNDKTDFDVRYDLFQRLNTGGVTLTPQEIRNCVYRGQFRAQLEILAQDSNFRTAVILKKEASRSDYEDLVLRFFAYLSNYEEFESSVLKFLNSYMKDNMNLGISIYEQELFKKTVSLLATSFPKGIRRKNSGRTPLNLFEALAVGTALAIKDGKTPSAASLQPLLDNPELDKYWAGGGTNSRTMVRGRIEYVRDHV